MLVPWLVARGLVLAGFVLAYVVAQRSYGAGTTQQLGEGLVAWDGTYYRDIATVGYGPLPLDALRFFPLYALAGRGLGFVVRDESVALVLLANAAAFALLILVRRLVLLEKDDARLADRAVWVTALFPSAFVLVWGYAEALFLCFAVATFLAMRRDRWGIAAACAAAAAMTRPLGVLLAVPLLIDALVSRPRATRTPTPVRALAAAGPVAGAAIYLAWVRAAYGDALLPFRVQGDLRGDENPIVRIGRGLADLVGPERFGDGLHIPFALVFVALLVVCFRRWPVAYGAFATATLLAALSADNLNSLERYGLNAFPLLFALASLLDHERTERIVLVVCGGGVMSLSALAWLAVYVP